MRDQFPERVDLREIISTLTRGWWLILGCVLVMGGAALALSLTQEKRYMASASLLFRDPAFDQKLFGSTFFGGARDPDREAATNLTLVGLRQVSTRTAARPEIDLTADQVRDAVALANEGRSDVVTIDATDTDPANAALVANAFAEEFIEFRRRADQRTIRRAQRLVEGQISALSAKGDRSANSLRDRAEQLAVLESLQTGNAELVQRAGRPEQPSSPRPMRNTVFGLFLGGLLGIGLVFLLGRLDRRLRSLESLEEAFGRPVLARVPIAEELKTGLPERRSHAEVAFSTLWTNLRYFNVTHRIDSVLVTSTTREDGKSTVALNLAAAAARSGSRVLLIEADLRRPSLVRRLGLSKTPVRGLSQILASGEAIEDVTVTVRASATGGDDTELDVLFAGWVPPNPAEMLDSEAMRALLRLARERYDLVVVDTPPSKVVPDAVPLLQQVSAVLAVARVNTTTRDAAAELRSQLEILDAPFVGVVANYTADAPADYYYGPAKGEEPDAIAPSPLALQP